MNEINIENRNTPDPSPNNAKGVGIFIAIISVIIILAIIVGSTNCAKNEYLTYENYTQIQNGMTYSQVVEILDNHQGTLDTSAGFGGYTLSYYTWTNDSGSRCIVVGFENGRVCVKSQYGLT